MDEREPRDEGKVLVHSKIGAGFTNDRVGVSFVTSPEAEVTEEQARSLVEGEPHRFGMGPVRQYTPEEIEESARPWQERIDQERLARDEEERAAREREQEAAERTKAAEAEKSEAEKSAAAEGGETAAPAPRRTRRASREGGDHAEQ